MTSEFDRLADIAAEMDAAAVIEAAEAWKRDGADLEPHHAKRLGLRALRDSRLIEISLELAAHDVVGRE